MQVIEKNVELKISLRMVRGWLAVLKTVSVLRKVFMSHGIIKIMIPVLRKTAKAKKLTTAMI
jgi:hypothetical protein